MAEGGWGKSVPESSCPSMEGRPRGSAWESPSLTPRVQGYEGRAPSLQALSSDRARGQQQTGHSVRMRWTSQQELWSPGMGENLPRLRTLAVVRSVEWGPGRGLKSGQGDPKALRSTPGLVTSALAPPNGLLLALGSATYPPAHSHLVLPEHHQVGPPALIQLLQAGCGWWVCSGLPDSPTRSAG